LVLRDRAQIDPLRPEGAAEAIGQPLRVDPGGQLQEDLVARPRAEGQEPRLRDARGGDEDPRPEGRTHAHVPGDVQHRPPDHEPAFAEGEGVADRRIQRDQERRVDEGAARLGEAPPLAGGGGIDRPVERVAGLDGGHLHEAGP
jgi:hypothetical protein